MKRVAEEEGVDQGTSEQVSMTYSEAVTGKHNAPTITRDDEAFSDSQDDSQDDS
jgi:hypothetical protein